MSYGCSPLGGAIPAFKKSSVHQLQSANSSTCMHEPVMLQPGDADLSRVRVQLCEDQTSNEESAHSQLYSTSYFLPLQQFIGGEVPTAMLSATDSFTRRNKRKNFQPRNIKHNEYLEDVESERIDRDTPERCNAKDGGSASDENAYVKEEGDADSCHSSPSSEDEMRTDFSRNFSECGTTDLNDADSLIIDPAKRKYLKDKFSLLSEEKQQSSSDIRDMFSNTSVKCSITEGATSQICQSSDIEIGKGNTAQKKAHHASQRSVVNISQCSRSSSQSLDGLAVDLTSRPASLLFEDSEGDGHLETKDLLVPWREQKGSFSCENLNATAPVLEPANPLNRNRQLLEFYRIYSEPVASFSRNLGKESNVERHLNSAAGRTAPFTNRQAPSTNAAITVVDGGKEQRNQELSLHNFATLISGGNNFAAAILNQNLNRNTEDWINTPEDSCHGKADDPSGKVGNSMEKRSVGRGETATTSSKNITPVDYGRYMQRFATALECGHPYCRDLNCREHFHCLDCHQRIFLKKEEMIRHFKWHKKRDESLQHGFMRYSPSDDCNDRYHRCPHNHKQTHYHCVKEGCDKVYVSTSDVQMHANYHRKDSAIIQEGFQRFRATEDCATSYCAFKGQRTTHFHCRRQTCNYTFKNKADMEKHKSYHVKDEQLTRDGFKKFMKNEDCQFDNCRFSKVCNHIHCIRPECSYVLHSSGQLYSHKRKHERRDAELAYNGTILNAGSNDSTNSSVRSDGKTYQQVEDTVRVSTPEISRLTRDSLLATVLAGGLPSLISHFASFQTGSFAAAEENSTSAGGKQPSNSTTAVSSLTTDSRPTGFDGESSRFSLAHVEVGQTCKRDCQAFPKDHYHCRFEDCYVSFMSPEMANEHMLKHQIEEHITRTCYTSVEVNEVPNPCPSSCQYQTKKKHYHCCMDGCAVTVLATDKMFSRLDHNKTHERGILESNLKLKGTALPTLFRQNLKPHTKNTSTAITAVPSTTNFSTDSIFRRKRGRPPKNRIIEVWNEQQSASSFASGSSDMPQAIFTSFKLPKPSTPPLVSSSTYGSANLSSSIRTAASYPGQSTPTSSFLPCYPTSQTVRADMTSDQETRSHSSSERLDDKPNRRETGSENDSLQDQQQQQRNSPVSSFSRHSEHSILTPDYSAKSITVVKASGTFYPESEVISASTLLPSSFGTPSSCLQELTAPSMPSKSETVESESPSSAKTKAEDADDFAAATLEDGSPVVEIPLPVAYGPTLACGRPFCKLKRRDHYHCDVCNQAFSDIERLKPHLLKHSTGALSPTLSNQLTGNSITMRCSSKDTLDCHVSYHPEDVKEESCRSVGVVAKTESACQLFPSPSESETPALLRRSIQPADVTARSTMLQAMDFGRTMHGTFETLLATKQSDCRNSLKLHETCGNVGAPTDFLLNKTKDALGHLSKSSSSRAAASNKRSSTSPVDFPMLSPETKKLRYQGCMRILKEEPIPEGYVRYRFNEDCQYTVCGYREHQTHFHCMRPDCGYSFCDKTRFVQHTARHERLDTLMGGDFQQYRANVSCGRTGCLYTTNLGSTQSKASHFHCVKCEFACTDTNKVVAHRRQHSKTDSILAAGFEKYTPSQSCRLDTCAHSNKQTHYHCVKCGHAVLGLAQMSAHKYRHLESTSPS